MGRLGTDVMALACIIGGATLAGAATMAALEASGDVRVEVEPTESCAVAAAQEVMVRFDRGELRVGPPPPPRIHASSSCTISRRVTVVRMGDDDHRDLHQSLEVELRRLERGLANLGAPGGR